VFAPENGSYERLPFADKHEEPFDSAESGRVPRLHDENRKEGHDAAKDESGQQKGLASQASAKVQDAASVAQEKGTELREQGSARIRDQFDQRSTQAGTQARSLAQALRRSGKTWVTRGTATRRN
jgi:hypothetical protein